MNTHVNARVPGKNPAIFRTTRMRSATTCFIACGLLSSACSEPEPYDPLDPEAIAAIDLIVEEAVQGVDAADADRVLAMAEGVEDLTFITGDVMLRGLEMIRSSFDETYEGVTGQSTTVLVKEVRLIAPDVAVVSAVSEGTYTDAAGWTSEPVGMGHTLVFTRDGGQWHLRHAHQSIAP